MTTDVARFTACDCALAHTSTPHSVRVDIGGQVAALSLSVENGRVARIYVLANPHKLARLKGVAALTRS